VITERLQFERFFMIARCDGKLITWPQPTHGDPNSLEGPILTTAQYKRYSDFEFFMN